MLSRIRQNVMRDTALMLYKSLVLLHLEYCDIVWDTCANNLKNTIQNLQKRVCKIILKTNRYPHTAEIHQELKLWMLTERRKFHTACMAYRCQHGLVPEYLRHIYQYASDVHAHDTRNAANNSLFVISNNSESGKCMFRNRSVILFNSLPAHVKNGTSVPSFKRAYTTIQQT